MKTGRWHDHGQAEDPVGFRARAAARDWLEDQVAWQLWLRSIRPHAERPRRRAADGTLEGLEPAGLA